MEGKRKSEERREKAPRSGSKRMKGRHHMSAPTSRFSFFTCFCVLVENIEKKEREGEIKK